MVHAPQISLPRIQNFNDVLSAGQRDSSICKDYISQKLQHRSTAAQTLAHWPQMLRNFKQLALASRLANSSLCVLASWEPSNRSAGGGASTSHIRYSRTECNARCQQRFEQLDDSD